MLKNIKYKVDFLKGAHIKSCPMEVNQTNKNSLRAFSIVGFVMISFGSLFGAIMRSTFTFSYEFFILWVYFVVLNLIVKLADKFIKNYTLAFYACLIPLMAMGIYIGTFGDPFNPSITIMVFICVLPMFILDEPWRIIAFIVGTGMVYTICCYKSKDIEMFTADMIDLVLFSILGIGVNCVIINDRIGNVIKTAQMRVIAETDVLTSLYNRRAGEEKITQLVKNGNFGMFMLIDLDNFKAINDNYGHTVGDKVLIALSDVLRETFSENSVIMRFGGDEFAVYVQGVNDVPCAEELMKNVLARLNATRIAEVPTYSFSTSFGCILVNSTQAEFNAIYRNSDNALYKAKNNGKNTYCIIDEYAYT